MDFNPNTESLSLCFFEIEADLKYPPEKIYNFFVSRGIALKEFTLKEKNDTKAIYNAGYSFTIDSLTDLYFLKIDASMQNSEFKITRFIDQQNYQDILKKCIDTEKHSENKYITYDYDYINYLDMNFIKGYGTSGFELINQQLLQSQRTVISQVVQKIGVNLMKGKGRSALEISLPISMFDVRTNLDYFAWHLRLIEEIIEKAVEASSIERLKLLTKYLVAILRNNIPLVNPIIPIVGETFQAKVGKACLYMEQTSHNPLIFNFYLKHPVFIGHGYINIVQELGANSTRAVSLGNFEVKFNDGALYKLQTPAVHITGTVMGTRYLNFEDNIIVDDVTNELISVINFNKEEAGFFGKFFSTKKIFPDYITGFIANKKDVIADKRSIYKVNSDENILVKYEGEWSTYLNCNGQLNWEKDEFKEIPQLEKMEFTLPSDSRFRPDVLLLKNGYSDFAQQAKVQLEETERNDNKLRANYAKSLN